MPEPKHGRADFSNGQGRLSSASICGIVYHRCGSRFDVDTYANSHSSQAQSAQASDPRRAVAGAFCPGCGRQVWTDELLSWNDLQRRYPGLDAGKAIRRWQKDLKKREREKPAELPTDPNLYEQRRMF